jgi:LuxR family transcriptional regulator, maltose regulon positive regulatory protein
MVNITLAKLTRPRLYGSVPRSRLFQRLDERRQHPLLWINGPPGAGKTSLVASYVTERQIPGIWYQVDAEDGDPATFFYYLGKAIETISKGKVSMPVLTPEHVPELSRFVRRFFRDMFARLDEGSMIVLDNCQEAAAESIWTELIEIGAAEIPDGINLICISRTAPPPVLARLMSTGRLNTIEWSDLRLTLEEARQIATAKQEISETTLIRLLEQSDGWAAGLILMLERIARTGEIPEAIEVETQEEVFNYFAGTLFDRISIENRHMLLCTALLPSITATLAEKLTGNPSAGKLLEDLHRRQLFTYRRHLGNQGVRNRAASTEPIYEYHALFRAFLRSKAKEDYTQSALRRQAAAAARLLDESGQPEAAIALFREAEDEAAQTELILRQAPALLRQGRGQTIREWIGTMPPEALADEPWLSYWLGVSLIPIDQIEASKRLERAFDQLAQTDDAIGQALVAARIIEAEHRAYTSLKRVDRWIEVLSDLISRGLQFSEQEVELRVYSSLLMAIFLRNPRHPLLKSSVDRLSHLVTLGSDPDQILTAGEVLLRYFDHGGETERADWVISLVNAVVNDKAVTPLSQLYWWGRVADFYGHQARYAQGSEALGRADQLAIDFSGHPAALVVRNFHAFWCLFRGDIESATQRYAHAHHITQPITGVGHAMRTLISSLVAAFTDTPANAMELNSVALAGYRESGMVFPVINTQISRAALLATLGSTDDLNTLIYSVRQEMQGTFMQHHDAQLLLIESFVAIRAGRRSDAIHLINCALTIRPISDLYMLRMVPEILPATFAFALREGVGEQQVKQWITRFDIRGGPDAPEAWPWPIKICTLGSFRLMREDRLLVFKGKLPRKPLELLKLLVCAGAEGLPSPAVADKLWPELDADAALNNLDTNIHRLRKVLGIETAIKSSDGRVSINAAQCWVDAWAFERLAVQAAQAEECVDADHGNVALELYRGHFLNEEAEQPWAVGYRARMRDRFLSLTRALGTRLQSSGDVRTATKLYERALVLDNLAEPLYRDLMHCLREQGEAVEALKVYRRCRELLSIMLGMEPSKETQALAATLRHPSLGDAD